MNDLDTSSEKTLQIYWLPRPTLYYSYDTVLYKATISPFNRMGKRSVSHALPYTKVLNK